MSNPKKKWASRHFSKSSSTISGRSRVRDGDIFPSQQCPFCQPGLANRLLLFRRVRPPLVRLLVCPCLQQSQAAPKNHPQGAQLHRKQPNTHDDSRLAQTSLPSHFHMCTVFGTDGQPHGTELGILHAPDRNSNLPTRHTALFPTKCKCIKLFWKVTHGT